MTGYRSNHDGLWRLKLPDKSLAILQGAPSTTKRHWRQNSCHALLPHYTTAQRVAYLHATLGSPSISTLCQALDAGFLQGLPLTAQQVRRNPPQSVAMWKGHLDLNRANQRSTKPRRAMHMGIVTNIQSTIGQHRPGRTYSDITGKFITQSSQGNNYILVVYDYDSNFIFAEPMPNRNADTILRTFRAIHATIVASGAIPQIHITDNEAAQPLIQFLRQQNIEHQLVPPNNHRANAAERAIRTFKNHFIAILSSCDPAFPLHLWDRLIPQAVITLNLLRASTRNPSISAYSQIHGPFNFDRTPLGPPGTSVLVHENPTVRGSWSPHGTLGWYIGPSLSHYRCFKVFIPTTSAERITDTLAWFPTVVKMPTTVPDETTLAAAFDLSNALLHPSNSRLSSTQRAALISLADIINQSTSTATRILDAFDEPRVPDASDAPMVQDGTDEPRVLDASAEPRVLDDFDEPRDPATFDDPWIPTENDLEARRPGATPADPMVHETTTPSANVIDPPTAAPTYATYIHNHAQCRRRIKQAARQVHTDEAPIPTSITRRRRDSNLPPPSAVPRVNVLPDVAPPPPTDPVNNIGKTGMRLTRRQQRMRFDHRTHRLIPLESTTSRANAATKQTRRTSDYTDNWARQSRQMTEAISDPDSNIENWTGRNHQIHKLFRALMTARTEGEAVQQTIVETNHKLTYRSLLKGRSQGVWTRASEMEFGRLAQGMPGLVAGTDTMRFISHFMKPSDRIASYCRFVCA